MKVQFPAAQSVPEQQQQQLNCVHEELKKRQTSDQPERGEISLAAFNIQIFGTSKFSKPDVVEILSRVS